MTVTVRKLLSRGDQITIECGRLVIHPLSGKLVPHDWLEKHSLAIQCEILCRLGLYAYEYSGYSTGLYGGQKAAGVTLQLLCQVSGKSAYSIFNAELTRARTTKAGIKGSSLPKGHFRIGKGSNLYRFWKSTQLPTPKRLSALHDYLGNLRGILLTADSVPDRSGRLNAGTLRPLSISAAEVYEAFSSNNCRTASGQVTDNPRADVPDKRSAPPQEFRGVQEEPTAWCKNHGNAENSTRGDTSVSTAVQPCKSPKEQSVEDWLAAYSSSGNQN